MGPGGVVIDPESLRVAMILLVLAVAGFDVGMAFLMRTQKEAAGSGD